VWSAFMLPSIIAEFACVSLRRTRDCSLERPREYPIYGGAAIRRPLVCLVGSIMIAPA